MATKPKPPFPTGSSPDYGSRSPNKSQSSKVKRTEMDDEGSRLHLKTKAQLNHDDWMALTTEDFWVVENTKTGMLLYQIQDGIEWQDPATNSLGNAWHMSLEDATLYALRGGHVDGDGARRRDGAVSDRVAYQVSATYEISSVPLSGATVEAAKDRIRNSVSASDLAIAGIKL